MKKTKYFRGLTVLLSVFLITAAAPVLTSCANDRAVTLSDLEADNVAGSDSSSLKDAPAPSAGKNEGPTPGQDVTTTANTATGYGTAPATGFAAGSGTAQTFDPASASSQTPPQPVVYVCGKVVNPGVYKLGQDARISDALSAAGGFTEEADTGRINLAEFVFDGEMIYFPAEDEEIPPQAYGSAGYQAPDTYATQQAWSQAGSPNASSNGAPALININTAGIAELTSLPGIGDTRAEAIIKYREKNGPFKSPSDIKNVPGIGDLLFSGIEELICAY